jgi:hypothetical protein
MENTCRIVNSVNGINWPYDETGANADKTCFAVPTNNVPGVPATYTKPYVFFGKVMIKIDKAYNIPDILNEEGQLVVAKGSVVTPEDLESANKYFLMDKDNNVLTNAMSFSSVLAANGSFGTLTSDQITTEKLSTKSLSLGNSNLVSTSEDALAITDEDNKKLLSITREGNMKVTGAITSTSGNFDIAQDFAANDDSLESGDVVSIDSYEANLVTKSSETYDNKIVGIYSKTPGFRLSQIASDAKGKEAPVAMAGRIGVKVNSENGAIKKGDYLTSSSVPGVAMKATKPGQVLGRALDDFAGDGTGKISVFVNVSYADPRSAVASVDIDGNILTGNVSSASIKLPENIRIAGKEINGSLDNALLTINDSLLGSKDAIGQLEVSTSSLATRTEVLDSRLSDLESKDATRSAEIATAADLAKLAIDKAASQSANIDDLSKKIDSLLSSLNTASASAGITSYEALLASESAEPIDTSTQSTAELTGEITTYAATVQNTFKSFGQSYLGDTTIAGRVSVLGDTTLGKTGVQGSLSVTERINVAGTLSLTEDAINVSGSYASADETPTDGILYLQNSLLANLVDIFNGAVIIDKKGNITTKGNIKVAGDLDIEGAVTITAKAAEDIKAKDALYISGAGQVRKADATYIEKSIVVGIAAADAKRGTDVKVIIGGKAKGFKNLQSGKRYYLGTNAIITSIIPTNAVKTVPVGVAFSDNELIIQIAPELVSDTEKVSTISALLNSN